VYYSFYLYTVWGQTLRFAPLEIEEIEECTPPMRAVRGSLRAVRGSLRAVRGSLKVVRWSLEAVRWRFI